MNGGKEKQTSGKASRIGLISLFWIGEKKEYKGLLLNIKSHIVDL